MFAQFKIIAVFQTTSVRLPRPYSAPSSPFASQAASPYPSDDEKVSDYAG